MFSFLRTEPSPPPLNTPESMDIPTTPIQQEPPPTLGANCVLLVDDDPHVLAVGKAVLQTQHFEVVCAASGEIALDLMRHAQDNGSSYGAVVLDLTMPGGASGFEVLTMMREFDPNVGVVACSGYFQEDARQLCQAIGFYDVLAKPYNPDALCTMVRRARVRSAAPTAAPEQPETPVEAESIEAY